MTFTEREQSVLDHAQFVTDKFESNHYHWKFQNSKDSDLKHIRYKRDSTGYNSLKNRIGRFFRDITVGYFKPEPWVVELRPKRLNWFSSAWFSFLVHIIPEDNMPDCTVDGNIFHWSEDGEYVTLFNPMVGREVLKFINEESSSYAAQRILKAMVEAAENSFPVSFPEEHPLEESEEEE